MDKSDQLEPHHTNTFNVSKSNNTQDKNAVTEYNLNINLESLTNQQMSPKTEAIFQNFGDNKSIDIRNMNNSESARQLEQLMMLSHHLKQNQNINENQITGRQHLQQFQTQRQ